MKKRAISLFMCLCLMLSFSPARVFADEEQDNDDTTTRYTVLVLDVSGSMEGEPLSMEKQAAIKFCESMFAAGGRNHIAIVAYNSYADVISQFSDNIDTLRQALNSMGASSSTNIEEALNKADELLQEVNGSIENIVLLSDGIPCEGARSSEGPFTRSDSNYWYEYANAVYNTAQRLKETYNIYSLGFFHSLSGDELDFGKRIMEGVQNKGNYIVTNVDDLTFTFGNIADNITQAQMRQLYINQHIAYYNDKFKTEVQDISIPREDGTVKENTNYIIGNLIYDIGTDTQSLNYQTWKVIIDSFNLNFDYFDAATSNYDLILADIVTSSYYSDVLKESMDTATMDNLSTMLGGVVDYGKEMINELAARANTNVETLRQEWQSLAQMLDQLNITDDPGEYARLFGECSNVVDKYIKADTSKSFLESIRGYKGWRVDAISSTIGALVGGTISTATEMMLYYSCYDAYCTASETYKQVLIMTAFYANGLREIGDLDTRYYCGSLIDAIANFLDYSSEDAIEEASNVALKLAKTGAENLSSSLVTSFRDMLIDRIPIIGKLNQIRKIAGLVGTGAMIIVDSTTTIDDQAYAAEMLYSMFFLANCLSSTSDHFGEMLTLDNFDTFKVACQFDEAVRVWRCCTTMMCDLGIQYETYRLRDAQDALKWYEVFRDGNIPPYYVKGTYQETIELASWCSTAISMAALEKQLISNIHCHDVNLSYDAKTKIFNFRDNAQIVSIACPVTVTVSNESGERIALLSDSTQEIREGYEPYFHVIETDRGSNDFMKICFVPQNWNVSFVGTGTGTMRVVKADIVDGSIQNPQATGEYAVKEGTEGVIQDSEDAEEIIAITKNAPEVFIISFDANGGSVNPVSAKTVDGKLSSLPTPTRGGNYIFNGWYTDANAGDRVTTDTQFNSDTTVFAHWSYTGGGGSGGGGNRTVTPTYRISLPSRVIGGSIETNAKTSQSGSRITITVTPDDGYMLDWVVVKNERNREIDLTDKGNGHYTFTMPASDVSISVNFVSEVYSISISRSLYGSVNTNVSTASSGTIIRISSHPDSGYEMSEYTVCDSSGNILLTSSDLSFVMPDSDIIIAPIFVKVRNPFSDVYPGAYYDAIIWAYGNNVTLGVTSTTFLPNGTCTRAQAVTFLWRAAGSPEPTSNRNPFVDVPSSAYYYKAVIWAVEQGITTGRTISRFAPNEAVSRANVVTFLYRMSGANSNSYRTTFPDVKTNAYYSDAVSWAAVNGIARGFSDSTFHPNDSCTRGQIVTFLYRYFV